MAWLPVDRVGLYVPGGRAVYPSSVVMNVVPAQTAGVRSLAVASPPQKDTGRPHPLVLAACALLGVDEVYAVGGAQAIAMFAYGTDESAPVDLVTGPGNIWVTAALRVVDAYAAEHLEIQTRDARAVAERVRSAGAIFIGPWSPVSLGDYCAGSNHVLPTGGCARPRSSSTPKTRSTT